MGLTWSVRGSVRRVGRSGAVGSGSFLASIGPGAAQLRAWQRHFRAKFRRPWLQTSGRSRATPDRRRSGAQTHERADPRNVPKERAARSDGPSDDRSDGRSHGVQWPRGRSVGWPGGLSANRSARGRRAEQHTENPTRKSAPPEDLTRKPLQVGRLRLEPARDGRLSRRRGRCAARNGGPRPPTLSRRRRWCAGASMADPAGPCRKRKRAPMRRRGVQLAAGALDLGRVQGREGARPEVAQAQCRTGSTRRQGLLPTWPKRDRVSPSAVAPPGSCVSVCVCVSHFGLTLVGSGPNHVQIRPMSGPNGPKLGRRPHIWPTPTQSRPNTAQSRPRLKPNVARSGMAISELGFRARWLGIRIRLRPASRSIKLD